MHQNIVHITVGGCEHLYPEGTSYEAVAEDFQDQYPHAIVLVLENGALRELHRTVRDGAVVEMVTTADDSGYRTYRRSLNLLLLKAIKDVAGTPEIPHVVQVLSVSNGYFYQIHDNIVPDEAFLDAVKARMNELVDASLPITKRSVPLRDAREAFQRRGMTDKDQLFRFRLGSTVNLYALEEYQDYFYGYMVTNTRYLRWFDLMPYKSGFLLLTPDKSDPELVKPFRPAEKVFAVQMESEAWGESLGVDTVGRLNQSICQDGIGHIMLVEEARHEGRIAEIAREIAARGGVKFVMIAGPSSSGKTTFSRRLSTQLSVHGLTPHPISIDNYYKERKDIPRQADGSYDFECLEALDLALFENQMTRLLNGETVELPRYSFVTGSKSFKGNYLSLGPHDVLVVEGIHGLNEGLGGFIPADRKFKVYLSALTQMNIDEHNRIPTTDGRLIRRIVRDYRTRATSAQETIAMWDSVRRGEEQYIFPNQEQADAMFNSALIYEMSILKIYAEPLLFQIPEDAKEYLEAKRLLKFLSYFVGIPSDGIPNNSILREFIGGSCFDV
ncbi:MAG: nucleoside kinase [Eubacterium sp.]|nr:nucleoside kinase [Eubacterium sp.]